MAYVPVPKDLTKVKTKVAFNLTKRQLVCFGGGAVLGVPLFFLLKGPLGSSAAAMSMILNVCFLRPKQRPYKTNNFYAALERQDKLDREVYHIVYHGHPKSVREKAGPPGQTAPAKKR